MQTVTPVVAAYVPMGHLMQADAPTASLYAPAAHAMHALDAVAPMSGL